MKRSVFAVIPFTIVFVILFSGCVGEIKSPDSPPLPPAAFTAAVDVKYGDYAVAAQFTQNSLGSYAIDFAAPPSLEPLNITYEGGNVAVTYDELVFETDLKRFPETSFGSVAIGVLSAVTDSAKITSEYSSGVWTHSGECDAGTFVIKQSHETGFWQSIVVESSELEIIFSDFQTI